MKLGILAPWRDESCVGLISNPSYLDWQQRRWFCAELGFYPRDCTSQGGIYQGHRWVSAGLWDCIVERLIRTPWELHHVAQEGEEEPSSSPPGCTRHLQQPRGVQDHPLPPHTAPCTVLWGNAELLRAGHSKSGTMKKCLAPSCGLEQ